jgi:hypothetical protein
VPAGFVVVVAWLVPGAGHLLLGRRQKGIIFLATLPLMFTIGLWLQGRLMAFEPSDPIVFGMAVAALGNGIPYFIASAIESGRGVVTAVTYEYGNAFIVAAGLLNMLVMLDAFDVKLGRK